MNSVKKNYLFNLSYQILKLITPLITVPYISRVLGAEGIGEYSFLSSIVSYYVLFASMGIALFGQREISYYQDNIDRRSISFWSIKAFSLITTVVACVLYIMVYRNSPERSLYFIFLFNILGVFTDISWLYQGMEQYSKLVIRNFLVTFAGLIYIFLFVKEKNDLRIYIFGNCFFQFLGNASLWIGLPQYIKKPVLKKIHPFIQLPAIIALFIPTIAIKIYTLLDKTMIGLMSTGYYENGYYEQAMKIVQCLLLVVTSLGTVIFPRISFFYKKQDEDSIRRYMYKAYNFVWFIGIPLALGVVGTARSFVPWFLGQGYEKVIPLLKILSFLLIAIGINNITGIQYLIPTGREKTFTKTVCTGAVVNLLLNLVLIPIFQSIGAAIASLAAETVIALLQLFLVRKELSFKKIMSLSRTYWIAAFAMYVIVKIEAGYFDPNIQNTVAIVFSGMAVYAAILLMLKDEFLFENITLVKNKVKKWKK